MATIAPSGSQFSECTYFLQPAGFPLVAQPPLLSSVLLLSIASDGRSIILRLRSCMTKLGSILLAASLALAPTAGAQIDDPSETFLKAYMTAQQGEKLERDNQFGPALAKYRFAGSLLEELKKTHANWQPAIVEYRSRKVSESILRVQGKSGTQQDLAAAKSGLAGNPSASPQKTAEPTVEIGTARPTAVMSPSGGQTAPSVTAPAAVNDAALKEATRKLRERVDQLQAELQRSRSKISQVEQEKETLNTRLQESNSKLNQAQQDLGRTRTAEKSLRDRLLSAQASLEKIQSNGDADAKAQTALKGEIIQLKKAVAAAEEGRAAAEKERDSQSAKLVDANSQITKVTRERDEARGQLAGVKDAENRVQFLVAENTDLKQKLETAEKTVREISEDKPKREQELAEVRKQLEDLRAQLATSEKQNKDFEITVTNLRAQLEDASSQLEKAKLTGANAEETAKLTRENQILRNIVVRERQEEARREQAKKLMLAEFDKLKIKSDSLNEQIALLAQPVTKLTDEELALLRQPVVSISEDSPNTVRASFTYAKPSTAGKGPADVEEKPEPSKTVPEGNLQSVFKPDVPPDLIDTARQAKENFDRGKYRTAERQYQELLTKSPNNLYSLSNLGVVYFRTGKLKAAELTLKKAVAISPKDEFAHTTLGIVYYRQSKFDDALNELTKSLAINPKSATAHNYLGITASQKGWQEAAEKEMLEAISVKPDYADAHFNLAVIYATASPPSKELAKRHYVKATELGAEPDASLERLLR
jgi:Flp pilus assembly protein TadD/septal ring factor EnvC (AmiA/AmiB activator)